MQSPTRTHAPRVIIALTAAMSLSACGDADTADPIRARGLSLALAGASPTAVDDPSFEFADGSGQRYALGEARFVLRHIELDLPDGVRCDDIHHLLAGGATCDGTDDPTDRADRSGSNDTVRIDGPFVVDLAGGRVEPPLDGVRLPDLAWRRVDLRVDDADDALGLPEDDPLHASSWYMTASFERDAAPLSLSVGLKFNEDIRFEAEGGVATDTDEPLLIAFDVSRWLDGLPIGACIDDGELEVSDGVVAVSDRAARGACADIEGVLKDNLKNSADLR